jgi:hypothetical protein
MIILSFVGIVFALKNKNPFINLLSLIYISHIILHIYVNFIDRYRHTVLPVIYLIAGYGLWELLKYASNYSKFSYLRKVI